MRATAPASPMWLPGSERVMVRRDSGARVAIASLPYPPAFDSNEGVLHPKQVGDIAPSLDGEQAVWKKIPPTPGPSVARVPNPRQFGGPGIPEAVRRRGRHRRGAPEPTNALALEGRWRRGTQNKCRVPAFEYNASVGSQEVGPDRF